MAGMDWFRWHHGSVTDPKFQLVARKSGASLPDVLAVWAYILETASQSVERGDFGSVDCEALDCLFGFPATETRTANILKAMQERDLVDGSRVASWEKRQPKRERDDPTNSDRQAAFKAKKNQVTPDNARDDQKTPREDKSREDKSREDQETSNLTVAPPFRPENGPALGADQPEKPKPKGPPDCPHREILDLWAEVLPALPQHLPDQWRGARADHLRARWRETAIAKGWTRPEEGREYFRRLFDYVAQSQFLTGRAPTRDPTKRPFVIELEWLVNPSNWAKVHEGKYHPEAA